MRFGAAAPGGVLLLRLAWLLPVALSAVAEPRTGFPAAPSSEIERIQRCTGPGGEKIFSDVPCAQGTTDIDAIPVAVRPPVTTLKFKFYELRGKTPFEVNREIAEIGPKGGWDNRQATGVAWIRFSHSISTAESPRRCALRSVQVVMDCTAVLPRWVAPPGASPHMHQEMRRMTQRVDAHELEHCAIAAQAAHELARRIASVPPKRRCIDLDNEIDRRRRNFGAHHDNLQRDFHVRDWESRRQ